MNHGSLFSGIGGFDLAAESMGWQNIFHCEWNEFGQKILKHYWPKAISYHDIKKTDFTIHRGEIDILTGGFPCQPYSLAGKRKGKEDDRHLWPEMLRAIREIQPSWVVGENVFGLINWGGGLVFHEVQADLEAAGYEVWPYVLPAAAVNAPHRRDRVWFVAHRKNDRYERKPWGSKDRRTGGILQRKQFEGSQFSGSGKTTSNTNRSPTEHTVSTGRNVPTGALQQDASNANSNGQFGGNGQDEINAGEGRIDAQRDIKQMGRNASNSSGSSRQGELQQRQGQRKFGRYDCENEQRNVADLHNQGLERGEINGSAGTIGKESHEQPTGHFCTNWKDFPTQPPICTGNDGIPTELDGITFPKWRNESIKAAGNAIVPQVALQIFKAIQEYENLYNKS